MLPIAQSACSATIVYFDFKSSTKIGIPPLSIIVWVLIEVPEATFVRAQAASNCKWGNYSNVINCISFGIRLASIIG